MAGSVTAMALQQAGVHATMFEGHQPTEAEVGYYFTMKRAQLTRILLDEAIRRGIAVEFGRRLEGATIDTGGRVTAAFQDGSRANGDLLVEPMESTRLRVASSTRTPRWDDSSG